MFALSTNNNNTQILNAMNYKVSSLFAVAFAFFAFAASANVSTDNAVNIPMEMTDTVDGAITMSAAVQLPDGSTSRKTQTFRNMQQAVDGYVKFVTNLPFGSTLIRVQFTDEFGNVVLAAQG